MAAVPGLSYVSAATGSCLSLRIRIRMIHSFNLTYYTAWGVENWAQENFWRSTGSAAINTFR